MQSHAMSQINPRPPVSKKGAFQPKRSATNAMIGAAKMTPMVEPLLNMPEASARSRSGNHSATTLTPAGQFPASPMPSRNRNTPKLMAPLAKTCRIELMDHQDMQRAYPDRVPSRSINGPE